MIPTSRRIVTLPFFFLGLPVLSVFLEFGMNRPHGLQVDRGYELLAKIREYYTLFLRDDITSCWFTLTGGLPNPEMASGTLASLGIENTSKS